MSLHDACWERRTQPVLSAMTTSQDWCTVQLYDPTVILHGGRFMMWFVGNGSATRTEDSSVGLAISGDGVNWAPHPGNPILTPRDIPWSGAGWTGPCWQTPRVCFDEDDGVYKMWFVAAGTQREPDAGRLASQQRLGYATSADGIAWSVHPEPIFPSGRGPSVLKDGPGQWRMWMNSAPDFGASESFDDLVGSIYRFTSADGIDWERDDAPVVTAGGALRSVVYPCVIRNGDAYTMWYGAHVDGGHFEIFCSTSDDGLSWAHRRDRSTFPASRDPNLFDGRYTSTPCVVRHAGRWLLYYSARDLGNLYGAGDGTVRADGSGIYRHIGVAECGG